MSGVAAITVLPHSHRDLCASLNAEIAAANRIQDGRGTLADYDLLEAAQARRQRRQGALFR